MDSSDAIQEENHRRLTWRNYSYDDLLHREDLRAEFDAMLAARPVWPSRIFVVASISFIVGFPLLAFLLE